MKTKKWALMFLLFAGIVLFAVQTAFGGCEVSSLDALIESGGNAPGTKLSGPITVFYRELTSPGPAGNNAEIYFFMRLRKGGLFYQFASGPIAEVPTDTGPEPFTFPDDIDLVAGLIEDFFINVVVPNLYECDPGYPDACSYPDPPYTVCAPCPAELPDVVLKSYDMDVDWEAPGNNGGLFYFITNIQIGLHD